MTFNSIEFLLFLPIVFMIYWRLSDRTLRNLLIITASYIFYGWWNWRFLLLIAFTTLCSYLSGLLLSDPTKSKTRRLSVLWINVAVNLTILGVFKYFNFFTASLSQLLSPIGIHLDSVTMSLILPVGRSFYTFQALSYSIDVYRHKIEATRDIAAFFAFISFFPQLVAGPIERATNLLPQFLSGRIFKYPEAVSGMRLILWGLFKKVVIADNCAIVGNMIFENYTDVNTLSLWYGALCFTFQIYGDFSGYSDMAIGVARLFGYNLMRNFDYPYFSRDITEFWRKWHISLTTWFRDYVYIPLGGSRVKKSKVTRNTFIIFLTSGLWHGANYTFIAWGMYHAILFLPMILTGRNRKHAQDTGSTKGLAAMREASLMGLTFLLVMIGWVIFRADNISMAGHYIFRMFSQFKGGTELTGGRMCLMWIAVLIIVEWIGRRRQCPLDFDAKGIFAHRSVRWTAYYLLCLAILLFSAQPQTFIYFQF